MKRLHVHVAVKDLDQSIRFYSTLFGVEPSVTKPDYAKWMLDDPRVNFAISTRGGSEGLDHLGIQVENHAELNEVYAHLKNAEGPVLEQGETTCCYAKSEKAWIVDPQGISWETFLTTGESTVYGDGAGATEALAMAPTAASQACCGPSMDKGHEKVAAGPTPASQACCARPSA